MENMSSLENTCDLWQVILGRTKPWKCMCKMCYSRVLASPTFLTETLNIQYCEYNQETKNAYNNRLDCIMGQSLEQAIVNLAEIYEIIQGTPCLLIDAQVYYKTVETVKLVRDKFNSNTVVKHISGLLTEHLNMLNLVLGPF